MWMGRESVEAKRELLRVGQGQLPPLRLRVGQGQLPLLRLRGTGAAQVAGLLLESAVPPARGVTSGW